MMMKTSKFCFGKLHFKLVLAVGDMLEQNVFVIPDSNYLVDNITYSISASIKVFLHSILLSTQPNDLSISPEGYFQGHLPNYLDTLIWLSLPGYLEKQLNRGSTMTDKHL